MSSTASDSSTERPPPETSPLRFDVVSTPIGKVTIFVEDDGAVRAIDFGDSRRRTRARRDAAACAHVRAQLDEYFAGERRVFALALRPRGTQFQQQVWRALLEIPFGATASYGEIARKLGPDTSPRAVGTANGANPIPIVIPCHRVIGSDGSLTGYGGGLDIKAKLLRLEDAQGSLIPT